MEKEEIKHKWEILRRTKTYQRYYEDFYKPSKGKILLTKELASRHIELCRKCNISELINPKIKFSENVEDLIRALKPPEKTFSESELSEHLRLIVDLDDPASLENFERWKTHYKTYKKVKNTDPNYGCFMEARKKSAILERNRFKEYGDYFKVWDLKKKNPKWTFDKIAKIVYPIKKSDYDSDPRSMANKALKGYKRVQQLIDEMERIIR